jgi:hypothetical protein
VRSTPSGSVTKSVRVTPAMEAGIESHVWTIDRLCALLPIKTFVAQIDESLY